MDKYVPKENVPSNSYGGDIGSKYGRGGFNSGSNYGKPISFDSGHSNQNEFKKDTFKVNKDFDFDSLL
ncbi:MAG: hypothetical protein MJ252_30795, partial [archaeon]|nr:hypothetical protein [archaeon]